MHERSFDKHTPRARHHPTPPQPFFDSLIPRYCLLLCVPCLWLFAISRCVWRLPTRPVVCSNFWFLREIWWMWLHIFGAWMVDIQILGMVYSGWNGLIRYWGRYILDWVEMGPLWIAWRPFVVFSPLHGLRYRGIDSSFFGFLLLLIREW